MKVLPNPSKVEIREIRTASGMTQTEAAKLVHTGYRVWRQWETGERKMHAAFWELFLIKARGSIKPRVKSSQ